MLRLTIAADLRPVHRAMIALGAKQVPFANALALNSLARGVAALETESLIDFFEKATPFTKRAFRIEGATKAKPIAVVAAKDRTNDKGGQAAYIAPYVEGGSRFLGTKRAMLVPIEQRTNQYGNLPKSTLARLKAKPNVFIGKVQTKKGLLSGVWQRPAGASRSKAQAGRGALKLLIAFENTTPVRKRFDFYGKASNYVRRNAAHEYTAAMRKALATARR